MRSTRLSYLLAALLWAACVFELVLLPIRAYRGTLGDTPLIGRLINSADAGERILPILVLIVFAWILVEVLFHALRVLQERAGLEQVRGGWSAAVTGKQLPGRRMNARAHIVRDYVRTSPATLHEVLPATAVLDAGALENSYLLTRAYVWTLPVLGFIGTAWGMAHAIGGFSQALKETSDVRVLADRLGQLVIPGLSNAFGITMLALGASVIAHFCVSTVQSLDSAALHELDQSSVALLAAIPKPSGGSGTSGGVSPEDTRTLFRYLEHIVSLVEHLSAQLNVGEAAAKLTVAAERLADAAGAVKSSVVLPYHITITRGKERE